MKLTFKRREVSDLQHLRSLVSDNSDAMEPGLKILASTLNLGRTTVDLAAIDAHDRPVLFVLGLTADDAMLVRALEAYAWCLEYPESIQRLVPASVRPGWPPRIVFVAERLLEAFVRKMRLLSFSAVDCFEFRYVEANGTAGFYLDRVDWAPGVAETATARSDRAALPVAEQRVELREEPRIAPREEPRVAPREESRALPREESRALPREERVAAREERVVSREEPKVVLLREEVRDDDHVERDEEPLEDEVVELREELEEEPKVAPRDEPRVIPLIPVEEPRIVMLHETKPAPRSVEPASTNGARKADANDRPERQRPGAPVLLKGLRPPSEAPPQRRSREVPDVLRPPTEPRPGARETSKPPAPAAPAASRASHIEPRVTPGPGSRVLQPGVEPRAKNDAARVDASKNGSKSDGARPDLPKGDLAPTWRKFLDRLTSTFDARTAPAAEPARAGAPPSTPAAPPPLTLQPFAADIEVQAHEVAPDEVIDEAPESVAQVSETQRRVLQGVTMPDNGELAPQWRKFLDNPRLDETKIGVVRGYLQREFPLCTVYDFYDFQRNAQVFQLQDNHGKVTQLITMTAEFFDSHRDLEIRAWIEKHRLAQAMRQAGQAGVLVSQAGLQIEKR
jgi:hypothetical protein